MNGMNGMNAKKILELNDNYTESEIKKNYKRLIMLYHPDKCSLSDASEKFNEIQSAYKFLTKTEFGTGTGTDVLTNELLKNIFMSFSSNFKNTERTSKKNTTLLKRISVLITAKEYFTGIKKRVKTGECKCELILCDMCAGCGYSIDDNFNNRMVNFNMCMNCLGDGWNKICGTNCTNGSSTYLLEIPSCMNLNECINHKNIEYKISISDSMYFYENENIYYNFDITLKESLIGFKKIFKDPFDFEHTIIVKDKIIKQNDGYIVNIQRGFKLILLFNVIYPDKILRDTQKILESCFI